MKEKRALAAYTFSHLCVDFACFYMLFHGLGALEKNIETISLGFLFYNVIAFGLQPFIGSFCDIAKKVPIAPIGCIILISGLLLPLLPWASLFICALGNACFHVGGGIDSLINANGKMFRSGIFVSSGALGVTFGTLAGKSGIVPLELPALLLFVSLALLIFLPGTDSGKQSVHFCIASFNRAASVILVLCFAILMIRSYTGSIIPMEWRTAGAFVLLPGLGAFIGKATGGFLADWYGARNVGLVSLLISLPLLCFGYRDPLFCTMGILFFNMTMPITLCAIADKLPGNPGLAFGLTTLGLMCGSMPSFFFVLPVNRVVPFLAVLILISVSCIYTVMTNQKGVHKHEKEVKTA